MKNNINGVGQDVEVIRNSKGGLQSKSIGAFYLIDPDFINDTLFRQDSKDIMLIIGSFMRGDIDRKGLTISLVMIYPDLLERIARVMEYGATKANNGKGYPANNWKLIPQEEHINHALIHLYAYDRQDTQDNHLDHCLTRLMFAVVTEPTEGFKYTEP